MINPHLSGGFKVAIQEMGVFDEENHGFWPQVFLKQTQELSPLVQKKARFFLSG